MFRSLKYNRIQTEKTADLTLEVAKYVFLGIIVNAVFPSLGNKVGTGGFVLGIVIFILAYILAMWLLRR